MAKFKVTRSLFTTIALLALILLNIFFIYKRVGSSKEDLVVSDTNSNPNFVSKNQPEKKSIEQKMKGVHLVENDQDKKGWELLSEEAIGEDTESWTLKKVKVQFYSEDDSTFTVTGDVGEVDGPSKNMLIRGNVVTQSENGYTFVTNQLKYDSVRKILYTEDSVSMSGPPDKRGGGFNLVGVGMQITVPSNRMKIMSQVRADKMVDGKLFKLTSNMSDFSSRTQEALFSGDVNMNYDKMQIQAPFAEFKYSKTTKNLASIYVYDKVEMKDEQKSATCKELIMDLVADQMILRGQPLVKMGTDQIQGEEITFYDKGKKMKISKMSMQRSGLGN